MLDADPHKSVRIRNPGAVTLPYGVAYVIIGSYINTLPAASNNERHIDTIASYQNK
jgi:hypothetical protein